jgi:hypothetical protein
LDDELGIEPSPEISPSGRKVSRPLSSGVRLALAIIAIYQAAAAAKIKHDRVGEEKHRSSLPRSPAPVRSIGWKSERT